MRCITCADLYKNVGQMCAYLYTKGNDATHPSVHAAILVSRWLCNPDMFDYQEPGRNHPNRHLSIHDRGTVCGPTADEVAFSMDDSGIFISTGDDT